MCATILWSALAVPGKDFITAVLHVVCTIDFQYMKIIYNMILHIAQQHIDGLMQERSNSIGNTLELHLLVH